jgi:hypothetical protein
LKFCTSGCDVGCCYDVTQNVDLYIRKGFLPPDDWQDDINHGRILYANPEPHYCFLPEIANGYLGTVAMSASLFQGGLFNGKVRKQIKKLIEVGVFVFQCGNIGKTRLPSPIGGSIVTGELIASGLHFEKGMFARRYQLNDQNNAIIEHRVYISQTVRIKIDS